MDVGVRSRTSGTTTKWAHEYAQQRMSEITQKYFSRAVGANVSLARREMVTAATSSHRYFGHHYEGLAQRARAANGLKDARCRQDRDGC